MSRDTSTPWSCSESVFVDQRCFPSAGSSSSSSMTRCVSSLCREHRRTAMGRPASARTTACWRCRCPRRHNCTPWCCHGHQISQTPPFPPDSCPQAPVPPSIPSLTPDSPNDNYCAIIQLIVIYDLLLLFLFVFVFVYFIAAVVVSSP